MLSEKSDYKDRLKPCKSGQMRVPVTSYRCINNATFNSQLQDKLKNLKPRSSRPKSISSRSKSRSSRKYFTARSRSSSIRPSLHESLFKQIRTNNRLVSNVLRSPTRRTTLPFLQQIRTGSRVLRSQPMKKPQPSFLNDIRMGKKLKAISPRKIRSPIKKPQPSFLKDIRMGKKLKAISPKKIRRPSPKKSMFNVEMINRRQKLEAESDDDDEFIDGKRKRRKRSNKKKNKY